MRGDKSLRLRVRLADEEVTLPPDLVLPDLVMPGKSGLEVCKIIKTQARTKNIPVIMFTALGRDVDRKLSAWAGFTNSLIIDCKYWRIVG